MNLAFCPNLRVTVSCIANVFVWCVISKDNLKALIQSPLSRACRSFEDD